MGESHWKKWFYQLLRWSLNKLIIFPSEILAKDEAETQKLAIDFIKKLNSGDRVVLNGEVGAGKTFFIKSALKHIGIDNVNSPSFAIVNEYDGDKRFYHFDFYRLKDISELYDIGWLDYINDDESIIFIEWGNLIPEALPSERIEILIEINNGTNRKFNFARFN